MKDEYISKADAAEFSITLCRLGMACNDKKIKELFNNLPSADVTRAIHAFWIKEPNTNVCACSNCKGISLMPTKYCGNCGAHMIKTYIEADKDVLKEITNDN